MPGRNSQLSPRDRTARPSACAAWRCSWCHVTGKTANATISSGESRDKVATRSVPTGTLELRYSEAHLLGAADEGIYLILEVLNVSRVANGFRSMALAQRAIVGALSFA